MQYDYLEDLGKEKGISISRLMDEIGAARSSAPRWKSKGYEPAPQTKKKIADYLGITVKELEDGGKTKKPADQKADGWSEDVKKMLEIYHRLTPENQKIAKAHLDFLLGRQE